MTFSCKSVLPLLMYYVLTCAHFNLLAFTCTYSICSRRQVSLEKVLPQISQMYICLLVCLYACLKSSIFDAARKSQFSQANGRSSFFLWRTWCASEKGRISKLKSNYLILSIPFRPTWHSH